MGYLTTKMLRELRAKRRKIASGLSVSLSAMLLSFTIAPCVLAATIAERPHHCIHTLGMVDPGHYGRCGDQCQFPSNVIPALEDTNRIVKPFGLSSYHVHSFVLEWTYVQPSTANQLLYELVSVDYVPVPPNYNAACC